MKVAREGEGSRNGEGANMERNEKQEGNKAGREPGGETKLKPLPETMKLQTPDVNDLCWDQCECTVRVGVNTFIFIKRVDLLLLFFKLFNNIYDYISHSD